MISRELTWWIAFNLFVIIMLAIDLGVFNRRAHETTIREALAWTGVWITLAMIFNLWIYFWRGRETALAFLTGYVIEKSLSVDNIFVFYLIFSYFGVSRVYQHKVLFWGILGALVMRAVFIILGIQLISRFEWMIYIFGAFLVVTGIRMAVRTETQISPESNPVFRLARRFLPTTRDYHDDHFFVQREARVCMTPLFVVLVTVEATDLFFALDSIPAILAITRDPFIVYTSNVFAILGLRALYFALAGLTEFFKYIHYGLAVILVFVGVKMLISHVYEIPVGLSLAFTAAVLLVSILYSVLHARGQRSI